MGNPIDPHLLKPLDLAYIGDSVYETVNRTVALRAGSRPVAVLHKECSSRAKASFQAAMIRVLSENGKLTEEEEEVFRRARNAGVNTKPKNATMADYHLATGFEAVIGLLYLSGRYDRLLEIIHDGWEALGNN